MQESVYIIFFKNLGIFFILFFTHIKYSYVTYVLWERNFSHNIFYCYTFLLWICWPSCTRKKICSTYSIGDHNYRSTTTCKRMPLKTKPTYYVGKGASYRRRHLLSNILSSVEEQDSISDYTRMIINHVIIAFRTTSGWCMKDNYNEWQRCCTQNLTGPAVNG